MAFRHRHLPLPAALLLAAVLAATALAAAPLTPDKLTYLSEEYYPFNYTDNGTIKGLSVDLLRLVWKKLGVREQPIDILPWARAYQRARREPHTVLFAMARTPEREHLFRWAGPILDVRFVLIAKKSRHIHVDECFQLADYVIGTVRGDVSQNLLEFQCPACTVAAVSDIRQNIHKLLENRVDMIAYEEHAWPGLVTRLGLDRNQFEIIFLLREISTYYAFFHETPQELVTRFQDALDAIRATSAYDRLVTAYFR